MLQISFIRLNAELVKERLGTRYFNDIFIVDNVVDLDEQVRKLKVETEILNAEMNTASKEIGLLLSKGEKEQAESKIQQLALNKANIHQLNEQLETHRA